MEIAFAGEGLDDDCEIFLAQAEKKPLHLLQLLFQLPLHDFFETSVADPLEMVLQVVEVSQQRDRVFQPRNNSPEKPYIQIRILIPNLESNLDSE